MSYDEFEKEIEMIVNMQQALELFSKQENYAAFEISNSFKNSDSISPFLNEIDFLWQLLWTINIFLRNRPIMSQIYLKILEDLIPELKKNEITSMQLFNIFLHKKFNNFIAIDLLYHKNIITINDIINQSSLHDNIYDYYKETLDSYYNKIINDTQKSDVSSNEKEFIQKYETIIETHKFLNSKSSSNLPNQSNNIQKLTDYIRKDDIDSFQEYISNTNMGLQTKFKFQIFNAIDSIYLNKEISLIEYAAYQGSLKIFKFLWNQTQNPRSKNLPLYSICGGNYDIIHIVESDSNLVFDLECLITSIELHLYEITEYLTTTKELKFPFETEYSTSYHYLFRIVYSFNMKYISSNAESFEFVINSIDDETGFTAIQTAAYLGLTSMVKVLSEIDGIDLMQTCRSGENVLYIACLKGFVQIVDFLLNTGGININCKTDNGMCALHAVVQNESQTNIEIIKLLLSNGINVNSFNRIFFLIFFLYEKHSSSLGCPEK